VKLDPHFHSKNARGNRCSPIVIDALIDDLEDSSIDLCMTSPPFALQRKKEYGNESQETYVHWLGEFCRLLLPKLKDTGSLVIDIGGADIGLQRVKDIAHRQVQHQNRIRPGAGASPLAAFPSGSVAHHERCTSPACACW